MNGEGKYPTQPNAKFANKFPNYLISTGKTFIIKPCNGITPA